MARRSFTSAQVDVKSLLFLALAGVSLLLWLVPAAFGHSTPYDKIIILVWIVAMIVMVVVLMKLDQKKRLLMHTVYIDESTNRGFSPSIGVFPCSTPDELVDQLVVSYAGMAGNDQKPIKQKIPEGFSPSLIVETSEFTFRRDEHVKMSAPIRSIDDITVETWSGRILDTQTGQARLFDSAFELEELV